MVSVCFYFQVHQPLRVRPYTVFEIGRDSSYFDSQKNNQILDRVAKKCYLPANAIMLELLDKHPEFKISYSVSGIAMEQFMEHEPRVVDSFRELAKTGRVEFLDETYYHSLSLVYSKHEFIEQVRLHGKLMKSLLGQAPRVFRNTELVYSNEVAQLAEKMGYEAILAEGADKVLGWRSPNFVYRPKGTSKIALLLKNYRLSDDIAFRFSERSWKEWPLTAEKFARWVSAVNGNGHVVNLFMDYETFGEHQWESTGIFEFLKALPHFLRQHPDNDFITPSEAVKRYPAAAELDVHHPVSWADIERDVSAWLGNRMQQEALHHLFQMEKKIKMA